MDEENKAFIEAVMNGSKGNGQAIENDCMGNQMRIWALEHLRDYLG